MNKFLTGIILLLFLGCESPKVINNVLKNAIAEYYETSDIDIMYIGKATIKISISNFIKEKENTSTGWGSLKPYASIGSIIVYEYCKNNEKIFDNILINIDNNEYEYTVEDVEKILKYYEKCNLFLEKLNNKDADGIYTLLHEDISSKDKEQVFVSLSSLVKINENKIIAYDVQENIYTIYVDAYLQDGKFITLRFSFLGDNEQKIAGIHTVN